MELINYICRPISTNLACSLTRSDFQDLTAREATRRSVAGASIPMGQGGHVPNIYEGGRLW